MVYDMSSPPRSLVYNSPNAHTAQLVMRKNKIEPRSEAPNTRGHHRPNTPPSCFSPLTRGEVCCSSLPLERGRMGVGVLIITRLLLNHIPINPLNKKLPYTDAITRGW